ncbi:MAG: CPBP family intramembrane metalloprotease [Rhizobiaceae bacterium]|jgi:membrane protease YdiL (CAAX protease family)|nr:CPBP family intramembrane metalloprotease [Rhizobiaceae bacterium]
MARYLKTLVLMLGIALALAALEGVFRLFGGRFSIFDTRGFGQVMLLLTPLIIIALFVRLVADDHSLLFFSRYAARWRRAGAGFLAFWLGATAIIIVGYALFAALGSVGISEAAVAGLTWKIAERTLVALFVVLVLATTEELIFRVFLMRYLMFDGSRLALGLAVFTSSLIFAALHNLTDPLAWFTAEEFPLFVGLFLLGVLLCVTYFSTGSITCAIAVHMAFLGSKVFLRRTELLEVDAKLMFLQNSADLRESPVVWALWIAMAFLIYLNRNWLRARFAVEHGLHRRLRDA